MTQQEKLWERALDALHNSSGICGHCGKKKCAGKQSNSTLPNRLNTDYVLAALETIKAPIEP